MSNRNRRFASGTSSTGRKSAALPKAELEVPVKHTSMDSYAELLQVPGMLVLQLKATGATAEDLQRFPARLNKEDGYVHFGWIKAHLSWVQNQEKRTSGAAESLEVLEVLLEECTQETLNAIVLAFYSGKITIDSSNALAVLQAADFLLATWLSPVICKWVTESWLPEDPLGVLRVGLKVAGYGLKEAAIKRLSAAWEEEAILQIFSATSAESEAEQCQVLAILSDMADLEGILQVLSVSEEQGYWKLSNEHILLLIDKYPHEKEILDCLLHEDGQRLPSKAVCQKLKLACLSLSARRQPQLTWRLRLLTLTQEANERVDSPEKLQTSDGSSFQIRLVQRPPGTGSWGIFVKYNAAAARPRLVVEHFLVECKGRAVGSCEISFPQGFPNHQEDWGFTSKLSDWLNAADADTDTDVLRLKLSILPCA